MRSDEGEPVHVASHGLSRNLPSAIGVALRAISSEFAAMNISMAVRAVLPDVNKDRLQVALGAINFFVHPAQGVTRRVVVELGNWTNRSPADVRVTVFARSGKWAMGIPAGLPLSIGRRSEGQGKHQEHKLRADFERLRNGSPPVLS